MSAVVQAEPVLSLTERARLAHAEAEAEVEKRTAEEHRERRMYARSRLLHLLEKDLDIATAGLEVSTSLGYDSSTAIACVDGVLLEWSDANERMQNSLAVLRLCDRCGNRTVPVYFYGLASLGCALARPGPFSHEWDCTDGLAPKVTRPPTTEEQLLAVLRDFVREQAPDARDA